MHYLSYPYFIPNGSGIKFTNYCSIQIFHGVLLQIYVRPMAEKQPPVYSFCNEPIRWHAVQQSVANSRHSNPVVNNQDLPYRFAVSIQRENFPPDNS